jgi:RNA polymerase sigma-70 factor (sigma-E family)
MLISTEHATGRAAREGTVGVTRDFEEYVAQRGPALLRLATLVTGSESDAQDAVQDALSRALPRWDRIALVDDPDAYVRRMVLNAHTSAWRRFRRKESPVALVRRDDVGGDPEALGLATLDHDRVWAACCALPHDQRVAVVLRFYEQLSYAEIAALTSVAEPTARSRVHRALERLRSTLDPTDPGSGRSARDD